MLSLYSPHPEAFDEDHRRVIEAIGRQIGQTFRRLTISESPAAYDGLKRLPALDRLEEFVTSTGLQRQLQSSDLTLLFIAVVDFADIVRSQGQQVGDDVLRHVMDLTARAMRVGDVLFRFGTDGLVALLNDASSEAGRLVAARVQENIRRNPFALASIGNVAVIVKSVSAPQDGSSLTDLIDRAKSRLADCGREYKISLVH